MWSPRPSGASATPQPRHDPLRRSRRCAGGLAPGRCRASGRDVVMSTDVVLPVTERGPEAGTVVLTVNGQAHALRIEPRVSLLDALREHLGLTGSKKGCDQGTCGACTVCTPGQIMSAVKLLEEGHAGNDAEIA